jgi:prephenate dehydratase
LTVPGAASGRPLRVAYQGEPGAFGEEAVRRHFTAAGREAEAVGHPTFADTFAAFRSGACDYAMLPVENSYAGSVHEVYDLLLETPEAVAVGEVVVPVHHCLIAPAGLTLAGVRAARSHPQALAQCAPFLRAHGIAPVAAADTAGAAREVAQSRPPATAAIASAAAARRYGLEVLARDIEAAHDNRTRFLLFGRAPVDPGPQAKTSVVLWAAHVPGSLARCLTALADEGLNLTKIESRPSRQGPWQYVFYLDFEGDPVSPAGARALAALAARAERVRVLGAYAQAPPVEDESAGERTDDKQENGRG